eukprot:3363275-Pleurochrysis_carterae.AAC.2
MTKHERHSSSTAGRGDETTAGPRSNVYPAYRHGRGRQHTAARHHGSEGRAAQAASAARAGLDTSAVPRAERVS